MTVHPITLNRTAARPADFLTQPFWLVMMEFTPGRYYSLSMNWAQMTDHKQVLRELQQSSADNETAYVIRVAEDGTRTDASAWFASLWLLELKEKGWTRDDAISIRFIRNHIENKDWQD